MPYNEIVATNGDLHFCAHSGDGSAVHIGKMKQGQTLQTGQPHLFHHEDPAQFGAQLHTDGVAGHLAEYPEPPAEGEDPIELSAGDTFQKDGHVLIVTQDHPRVAYDPLNRADFVLKVSP